MKVSIVVPVVTVNLLRELVHSLEKNTVYPDWELIIVNDGATEPALLSYLGESVHTSISLSNNVGFAGANNAGWQIASGDLLMTLNADTEVFPGWLTAMVLALKKQKAQMVGPTVLEPDKKHIQSFGCHWDERLQRIQASHYKTDVSFLDDKETHRVDGLSGCCMMMTRQELEQVGAFDIAYKNSWEDVDLCFKFLSRGYKIVVTPHGRIMHHASAFRFRYFARTTNIPASQQHFRNTWGTSIKIKDHQIVKQGNK